MGGVGIFGTWQPVYAEAGIPTFPVRDKKPAVRGYLKTGPNVSRQLAEKFSGARALGFACKRAGLTILDVDTPDENILVDALQLYGDTPIIVQSGSGHFQAWYRNAGDDRKIRPDPSKPIDILGGGYVVAPPSQGAKGAYRFLAGSLGDLPSLPALKRESAANDRATPPPELVDVGKRNDTLWRSCMRHAKSCDGFDDLLRYAHAANVQSLVEPLPDSEVVTIAQSAWSKQCSGDNRFGQEMTVSPRVSHYDRIEGDHFAVSLLMILRRRWRDGEVFHVANGAAGDYGFPLRKFVDARATLERHGLIVMVRKPIKGVGPAVYRFGQ